jgi:hypothetical protein
LGLIIEYLFQIDVRVVHKVEKHYFLGNLG